MKKARRMKPLFLNYNWKESPGQIMEDLEPLLKKFGLHVFQDPFSIGSDSYGYIVTDNPKMTIADFRKHVRSEFSDGEEWLEAWLKEYKLKDKDLLTKLIKAIE